MVSPMSLKGWVSESVVELASGRLSRLVYIRPCKIQCTFECHCVDKIIPHSLYMLDPRVTPRIEKVDVHDKYGRSL